MGEEDTRRVPPGRWLASDGNWYPPSSAPDQALWVVIDTPARLGCHPGLANIGTTYAWNPERGGVQCSRCRSADTTGAVAVASPVPPPSIHVDVGAPVGEADVRRILLKHPSRCLRCAIELPSLTKAGWIPERRTAICFPCLDGLSTVGRREQGRVMGVTPSPAVGVPGRSAYAESDRRGRRDGGQRYRVGAEGEVLTARALDAVVSGRGHVLHDRGVPGSAANIDHLAVIASGIWVVDSKNYRGSVRRSRRGPDGRLRVRGEEHHELVDGLRWQVDAVRQALGDTESPIHQMLVFPTAGFGWWRTSFELSGTWCCRPAGVSKALWSRAPVLTADRANDIALRLSVALPPA